jgi:hypothetical protein
MGVWNRKQNHDEHFLYKAFIQSSDYNMKQNLHISLQPGKVATVDNS